MKLILDISKARVTGHTRTLADGRRVHVPGHATRRTDRSGKHPEQHPLFGAVEVAADGRSTRHKVTGDPVMDWPCHKCKRWTVAEAGGRPDAVACKKCGKPVCDDCAEGAACRAC